jgi:hypothetical protein
VKKFWIIISGIVLGTIGFVVASIIDSNIHSGFFDGSSVGFPLKVFSSYFSTGPTTIDYYFLGIILDAIFWIVPAILVVWGISKLFGSKKK